MALLTAVPWRVVVALSALLLLPFDGVSWRALLQQTPTERAVKAEFLARLPLYVRWPEAGFPAESEPLVIGILGEDPLGAEIDRSTVGRNARGHPYRVVRFRELTDMGGQRPPHVLFVSASEHEDYERVARALAPDAVLLVGEEREFLAAGGHVTLGIRGNRPEIVIALDRLEERGLEVDSRLLEVARLFDLIP